ncbi:HlyD family efflux transporter periplasmic adaptor subunit [Candidatus Gracilibacteria bacterium]|nr:HlyD family efflux transporter periplasmic adaptor subunit [Candidatus Gracilibacteria bacterium]MCF7898514.1 HlyD family efflux transporter periplasmic adaptor subunit [Candidatus Paceibacterota bacterium]
MKTNLEIIVSRVKSVYYQLRNRFLRLSKNQKILTVVICVGAIILISMLLNNSEGDEVVKTPRTVLMSTVSEIINKESPIPLLGIVTSVSEATILAESGGKLTRVYKKLGDKVYAGQIIAEFENSAERAQVQQAEGAYESAKAARDITIINNGTVGSSLIESKTKALNAISSAYITVDDIIYTKTDSSYYHPRGADIKFQPLVPDVNLIYSLEFTRKKIEASILARGARNRTLTIDNDLVTELTSVKNEVEMIKNYLDDLATAYSKAVPDNNYSLTTLETMRATIGATRSAISGTIGLLTETRLSLTSSINAEAITGTENGGGSTATADAQVKQAYGAYNGALSRLNKTIIKSPITGTLNSLSIQTGDYVSQFTKVAVVSNNGALEVVTYVNEEDVKRIAIGGKVTMSSNIQGVITRIAGGIDPKTKKIEVRIGITSGGSSLINGQSIQIKVSRTHLEDKKISGPIAIPLSALKITPNGAYVYTTSTSSTLIAIPVTLGAILGDEMEITSGIYPSLNIVLDARGLKEGQKVSIQE